MCLSREHCPSGVSPREAELCRALRCLILTVPGPQTPSHTKCNLKIRQEVKGRGALHLQPVRWQYWCQPDHRAMWNPWTWCPFSVPFCFWAEKDHTLLLQRKAEKTPRSLSVALALRQMLWVFTKDVGCPSKSCLRCLSWVTMSTHPTVYIFLFFSQSTVDLKVFLG